MENSQANNGSLARLNSQQTRAKFFQSANKWLCWFNSVKNSQLGYMISPREFISFQIGIFPQLSVSLLFLRFYRKRTSYCSHMYVQSHSITLGFCINLFNIFESYRTQVLNMHKNLYQCAINCPGSPVVTYKCNTVHPINFVSLTTYKYTFNQIRVSIFLSDLFWRDSNIVYFYLVMILRGNISDAFNVIIVWQLFLGFWVIVKVKRLVSG